MSKCFRYNIVIGIQLEKYKQIMLIYCALPIMTYICAFTYVVHKDLGLGFSKDRDFI